MMFLITRSKDAVMRTPVEALFNIHIASIDSYNKISIQRSIYTSEGEIESSTMFDCCHQR